MPTSTEIVQNFLDLCATGKSGIQEALRNYFTPSTVWENVGLATTTGIDVDLHPRFGLAQPWPNPASSTVNFRLAAAPDSQVDLNVYDVAGRRVYGWRGRVSAAGDRTIEWNLRDFNGTELQSGIYFVRLHSADGTLVRRFVRLR